MDPTQLGPLIYDLTNRWCDRRALGALAHLLPAYPVWNGDTEEWQRLWRALRNVRGLTDSELRPEERPKVEDALRIVEGILRARGVDPFAPSA